MGDALIKYIRNKFAMLSNIVNIFKYRLSIQKFRTQWRRENTNNQTIARNVFPLNKVKVGKGTYGELNIHCWNSNNELLLIGNFVSIANDVNFYLGGNHHMNTLFTYPIKTCLLNLPNSDDDYFSKGTINIGDEVWIGAGVSILSGVKIGKGAIIGAYSVVAQNIEPYAVVVGNPAKTIKFRFSPEIIQKIEDINLEDISIDFIEKNIDKFYTPVISNLALIEALHEVVP